MRGMSGVDLNSLPSWWENIDQDANWQKYHMVSLSVAYGLVSLVAAVQLVRIQFRVPEYGWTTQKVFHLLNAFVSLFRCLVFAFRQQVSNDPEFIQHVLLDIPGLLFCCTYTLLVLFWAEIYHQARSLPTTNLRSFFLGFNALAFFSQISLWIVDELFPTASVHSVTRILSCIFLSFVTMTAAAGFCIYGGRLFSMLRRFPIESRGRRKKLCEVGLVSVICATCFSVRAAIVTWSALDRADADLDIRTHPLLNITYYTICELLPSVLVLYILRKLPPKRPVQQMTNGYQPIPNQP